MTLHLVRGTPGSGKSTFAKKTFRCCILENDQMQIVDGKYCWSPEGTKAAISLVRRIAEQILQNGADVCICNTFTKRRFIEGFKQLAEKYNADFKVYRCTGDFGNVHNVPEETLRNMKSSFEDWNGEVIVLPE